MKHKIWIIPHTHYDAEVFMVEKDTLELGYSNLMGALHLMRTDPTFKFVLDQTCYIEPFLNTYPEERAFFQQMIDEGRLEIVGGMVSMPDVNIPSGESFIRQILLGKRYIQKELNTDPRLGWTIDTFGHHPQMPQLMKKCGFDAMTFQRLMKRGSPSEFFWQGIDGTQIFCHWMAGSYGIFCFPPGNLYEFSKFVDEKVRYLEAHAVTPDILMCSGGDLTAVDPGMPAMIAAYNHSQDENELYIATPSEFFKAMQSYGKNFPLITDDLNPAFQGCYSARIDLKQWNRKLEVLLSGCEKWDAFAHRFGTKKQESRLDEAWKSILINQFHDLICGSHIDAAFQNAMDRNRFADRVGEDCQQTSLQALAGQIDTRGEGIPVVIFNSLSWERTDAVECPVTFSQSGNFELGVFTSAGQRVPSDLLSVERYADGSIKRARVLFIAQNVPAMGYEVYHIQGSQTPAPHTDLTTSHPFNGGLRFELDKGALENAYFRVEFDLWNGAITRLYDKLNHWEVLPEALPLSNFIVKERDFGNFWQYNGPCKGDEFYPAQGRYPLPAFNENQADFSHHYNGDGNILNGNARVEFTINFPFGSGTYATRVRLYAGIPRIDIHTVLVNGDERVRYRVAFPTSIANGKITNEIPFGAIERPEGEFPAQNWIDYADAEKGISLLNQGLPGNNVVDGVMMLSLLKCTNLEGGYGDLKLGEATQQAFEIGRQHTFDFALVPHAGDWRTSQAFRRGAEFNEPLKVCKTEASNGNLPERKSFVTVDCEHVVISAIKTCEDGLILRLYEAAGEKAAGATIASTWEIKAAYETNLIEQEARPLNLSMPAHALTVDLAPFEIKTFKLVL